MKNQNNKTGLNKNNRYVSGMRNMIMSIFLLIIIGSAFILYNKAFNTPTELIEDKVNELILESEDVFKSIYRACNKVSKSELLSIGKVYVINLKEIDKREKDADIAMTLNYPGATSNCYGTVSLEYDGDWYVNGIKDIKISDVIPLFTAGEVFRDKVIRDVYGKSVFTFDDINYGFARSYVDSLTVVTEGGDLEETRIGLAPKNTEDRVDMYATMRFNYESGEWELIDFEMTGGI